jgi:hypothetical protein
LQSQQLCGFLHNPNQPEVRPQLRGRRQLGPPFQCAGVAGAQSKRAFSSAEAGAVAPEKAA